MNEIDRINHYLTGQYGYFDGIHPNWRVVFSDDQLEKRWTDKTDEGLELNYRIVKEFKKYPYINHKYVLERCVAVPPFVETDLVEKYSYEPLWSFQDSHDNALPPNLDVCKIIIDQVNAASAKSIGAKYKDPEISDPKMAPEIRAKRISDLQAQLFGEDAVGPLEHGGGVTVPSTYTKQEIN